MFLNVCAGIQAMLLNCGKHTAFTSERRRDSVPSYFDLQVFVAPQRISLVMHTNDCQPTETDALLQ